MKIDSRLGGKDNGKQNVLIKFNFKRNHLLHGIGLGFFLFCTIYYLNFFAFVITLENLSENGVKNSSQLRVCYYVIPRDGERYGPAIYQLQPEEILDHLCTHIIIGAANILEQNIDLVNSTDKEIIRRVVQLKERNKDLQVYLSLCGGFKELVQDRKLIALFSWNARQFLMDNGLDGLDLDWEFPGWPNYNFNSSKEKEQFSSLLLQLNNCFKLASDPPFGLSVAVGTPRPIINKSYDVHVLSQTVDFISLMSYDYHLYKKYLPFTGHNAPLFPRSNELGYLSTLNTEWSANYWIEKGMQRNQIVIGIPIYGRTWKLLDEAWNYLGSPATSSGILSGTITYPEALLFKKFGAFYKFDEEAKVPYLHRDKDWISYDDEQSVAYKANWIKTQNVSGSMTFCLNYDDYHGGISGRRFHLHQIIYDILKS